MSANDKQPILFSKISHHGIKPKPGSVVDSEADPHIFEYYRSIP